MQEMGKKIDQLSNQLTELRIDMWKEHTLYTWQWWMLLILCVVVVIVFIWLLDRRKALEVFSFLGVIYILNKNLDDVATALDFYDYRIQLEPIIPTMLPANLFAIPVSMTLIFQRFTTWKSYLISLGLFAVVVSHVALPLMKKVDIYLEKTWNSHYSFLSLVVMGVIAKWFVDKLRRVQQEGA